MLTQEQLKERKNGIGGSDAAAICGVSKWRTPVDIYLDKTSEYVEKESSHIFKRGNALEPLVAELFRRQFKKDVEVVDTIKSTDQPFMFANIDGLLKQECALVEFKHYNKFMEKEWGDEGTDQIPDDYLLQVQHYLFVTKMKKAYVAVLFASDDVFNLLYDVVLMEDGLVKALSIINVDRFPLKLYEVHKNEKLIQSLVKIEKDFWENHVKKKTPPTWTTREDLAHLFPVANDREIFANDDDIQVIAEIKKQKEDLEKIEKEIEEKKTYLCGRLQNASALKTPEGSIIATWKNQERKTFDAKRFAKENPILANEFYNTKTHRVFRIGE